MDVAFATQILGLSGTSITSQLEYLELIREGLPTQSLSSLATAVAPENQSFKFRIVPKSTLARRKGGRLTAGESVLVARLVTIWQQAIDVWKEPEAARDFLYRKHSLLGGRMPIDLVLENEIGAQMVTEILGRLEHGSAA